MPIPSFFTPPRAVASAEQIRASLAAAREALPALQQDTVAAGMALAAELALDPNRQRIHARDQGMDMDALHRANSAALAKLRDQQDRIAAMEAALPFAVVRERREQAAATVKSDNMRRENRLRAIDKRRHELVRDAEAIATCFENLRNRRRSLASGLAELEIKGVDIDQFMRETFAQVFSASAYQWKQLPLEGFANNVAGRIDHAKAELEATPKRTAEDELADMDANDAWQARLAAREAGDIGRPTPAENVEALPPGMTRHAWSDVGGLVVGKAPVPKPPSRRRLRAAYDADRRPVEITRDADGNVTHVDDSAGPVYDANGNRLEITRDAGGTVTGFYVVEMTRGPDGEPMVLGELPPKPEASTICTAPLTEPTISGSSTEIDGEAPPASGSPDPCEDTAAEPSAHVDPVSAEPQPTAEPARIAEPEPEPPELGTDNPAYQEIAAKYRKPAPDDEWLGIGEEETAA